jgi:23S rRNA (pseudouridine1915-N3)-methyltransferase
MLCLPDVKNAGNMSAEQLKVMEGRRILEKIGNDDTILLDERGTTYSSMEFASLLSKKLNAGTQSLTFVVGGVYGFSAEVYDRAPVTVSLSRMTFTHQMVRLVFVEQLYRAFTILRGEAYHHE